MWTDFDRALTELADWIAAEQSRIARMHATRIARVARYKQI